MNVNDTSETPMERSIAEQHADEKKKAGADRRRRLSDRKEKDIRIKPIRIEDELPDDDITRLINLRRVTKLADLEGLDI